MTNGGIGELPFDHTFPTVDEGQKPCAEPLRFLCLLLLKFFSQIIEQEATVGDKWRDRKVVLWLHPSIAKTDNASN